VKVKEVGLVVSSLLVKADAPGCKKYSAEIRLIDGLNRVDIINEFDKQAVREKEGMHIAFPLNVHNGQIRYDVAGAIVRPENDQLDGSCKNFFSVQSWVDVSNTEYGITWATADAPMIEIGAITAEQRWMKSIQPTPLIYSYVMNNYWHTNYKADQQGVVRFRYSIMPHGEYKSTDAVRFGIERRQPLIVSMADQSTVPTSSLFTFDAPDVIATVKPIVRGSSWLVSLYNPTVQTQRVVLQWNRPMPLAMRYCDGFGMPGEYLPGRIDLTAYATAYVRVDRRF